MENKLEEGKYRTNTTYGRYKPTTKQVKKYVLRYVRVRDVREKKQVSLGETGTIATFR